MMYGRRFSIRGTVTGRHISIEPKEQFLPKQKANMKNERNTVLAELDKVRAQIERNEAKAQRTLATSRKRVDAAEAAHDKVYYATVTARDKVNESLRRKERFLAEEVKSLI